MSRIIFSSQLANGTKANATQVQTLLDELKDGANAIDDDNIGAAGISESKITFDTATGHVHSGGGTDGALLALAVDGGNQGSLKIRKYTEAAISNGSWSSNCNAAGAGQIDAVFGVTAMWNDDSGVGDTHACHTNIAGGLPTTGDYDVVYTDRYLGAYEDNSYWYVVIDDTQTPNEVYVYNATTHPMTLYVMLVGV